MGVRWVWSLRRRYTSHEGAEQMTAYTIWNAIAFATFFIFIAFAVIVAATNKPPPPVG